MGRAHLRTEKRLMSITKSEAGNLAEKAMQVGALVLRGRLTRDGDSGDFVISDTSLEETLGRYEGREVIVIIAPLDTFDTGELHVCPTCGREYYGTECPHCREIRRRFRRE